MGPTSGPSEEASMGFKEFFNQDIGAGMRAAREARELAKDSELQRTCGRCSTVWYVPADLKAPSKSEMFSAKLGKAGADLSLISFSRSRKQQKVNRLEDKAQAVKDEARCPSCGSGSFTETLVQL